MSHQQQQPVSAAGNGDRMNDTQALACGQSLPWEGPVMPPTVRPNPRPEAERLAVGQHVSVTRLGSI
jgi:hypothetical protein